MTEIELKDVLDKHLQWLNNSNTGNRANLCGSDLRYANLRDADLRYADLRYANLCGANLYGSDLRYANLRDADLCGANLRYADLRGAIDVSHIALACPSDGEFTAWKKVGAYLVKLLIPEKAKRCSATSAKCRCEYAKVLDIVRIGDEAEHLNDIINTNYQPNITYRVGEIVYPDSFDDDRWNECSHGIHFFVDKQSAIDY